MLKSTRDAIAAICAADPSVTALHVKAALAELDGEGVRCVMTEPAERAYTREQVAALLHRNPKTVSRYARQGLLTPIFGGADGKRATGYSGSSVKALLAGGRRSA